MERLWIMAGMAACVCASLGCSEVDTFGAPASSSAGGAQSERCVSIERDVHIGSAADLSQLVGLGCIDIAGSLAISETDLASLDGLEQVRSVGGFLTIFDNPNLRDVDALSSLQSVGGQLAIVGNAELDAVSWPQLTEVGGSLHVFRNNETPFGSGPGLEHLSFESLRTVGGEVRVVGEHRLLSLELRALVEVEQGVILEQLIALETLALDNLELVGTRFSYQYNRNSLEVLPLPALVRVGQDFVVRYNGDLVEVVAPRLEYVGGDFIVAFNRMLAECEAEALAASVDTIVGEALVYQNDYLAACAQDVCTLPGDLRIESEADITQFAESGCRRVAGDVYVVGTELRDLQGLESLRIVEGEFFIRDNPRLESLQGLQNMEVAVRLWIEDNLRLDDLSGLDALEATHYLAIRRNEALASLAGLDNLELAGRIIIEDNPVLGSIEALEQVRETHNLIIRDNPVLRSLAGLDNLETVLGNSDIEEGSVIIESNELLESVLALRALREVRNVLRIVDNPNVPTCQAIAVRDGLDYAGSIDIRGNDDTASCL